MEHSLGVNIKGTDGFIISIEEKDKNQLWVISDYNFAIQDIVELPIEKSDTREPNRVLCMEVSHDTRFIAIMVGKEMIKNRELL